MDASLATAFAAGGTVLAGWVVYPIVLKVLSWLREERPPVPAPLPTVSVVIATRERPDAVAARVADVRGASHPADRLDVVVTVDENAPFAAGEYVAALGSTARVIANAEASGKAAALNAGVAAATGDVLVFTDTAQRFDPATIETLARCLAERPDFGAVSGRLRLPDESAKVSVLGQFWRYELMLRRLEARAHSVVAVTGAAYAMRRDLWRPLPAALICDDLYAPLWIARRGHRVGHCNDATAHDERRFTSEQELSRKTRTLTGMLQMCAWEPWILVPGLNPLWVQFVCHKLIRLATPFLVAVAGVAFAVHLASRDWLLPLVLLAVVLGLGGALLLALAAPVLARKLANRGSMALRLLVAPFAAVGNAARGNWDVWQPSSRGKTEG
jgi:cellulose synthase/poly-beta-1,6-N-acetylglucosamine synthase-like glycosyltransferase